MTQDEVARGLSKADVRSTPHSKSSNPILHLFHELAAGMRRLVAELVAFPVIIRRMEGRMTVIAELPGIRKDEVKVEATDTLLVIYVEPKRGHDGPLRFGRRMIPMPEGAEIAQGKAELRGGVLTVSLPVPENRKYRHLPVESTDYPTSVSESS